MDGITVDGPNACFNAGSGGELVDQGQFWCGSESDFMSIPITILNDAVVGSAIAGTTNIPLAFGPNFFLTFHPRGFKGSTSSLFVWKSGAGGKVASAFRLDLSPLSPDQMAQSFNKAPLQSFGGQVPRDLLHANQRGMYRWFKLNNHQIFDPASQRGWFAAYYAARSFRYAAYGFAVASAGFAVYDVFVAQNVPREIVAQVSGFIAARQGCKLLATRAGAVLSESGPGALVAGVAGCVVGGGVGYGIGRLLGGASFTLMETTWSRLQPWPLSPATQAPPP